MGNQCTACNTCQNENEFVDKPDGQRLRISQELPRNYGKSSDATKAFEESCSDPICFSNAQNTQDLLQHQTETATQLRKFKGTKENRVNKSYTFKTRAKYTGQWLGGFRDGIGSQEWPDNAKYEGQWSLGMAHGKGKFYHSTGDYYEGEWRYNQAWGRGVYQNVNGSRYDGEWKHDSQHGKGVEVWADESTYEGDYIKGVKEGYGHYKWADGSSYIGEWANNTITGYGVYEWADGRKYFGKWVQNNMEGYGTYFWSDGRRYDGQYTNDKKDGFGIYSWADGRKYEGWWANGKQHGLGIYLIPKENQHKYGLWENGKRKEWFSQQQIDQIQNKILDYKALFDQPVSSQKVRPYATFDVPSDFNKEMKVIYKRLKFE